MSIDFTVCRRHCRPYCPRCLLLSLHVKPWDMAGNTYNLQPPACSKHLVFHVLKTGNKSKFMHVFKWFSLNKLLLHMEISQQGRYYCHGVIVSLLSVTFASCNWTVYSFANNSHSCLSTPRYLVVGCARDSVICLSVWLPACVSVCLSSNLLFVSVYLLYT